MAGDDAERVTRPDLTKYPAPPTADADYWQPYEPFAPDQAGPLAALDQQYPPYPVPYGQNAFPGGPYPWNSHPGVYSPNPYLMAPNVGMFPRTNSMATAALICSLVAIPGMVLCLGFVLAPAGLIMGIIALGQIRDRPHETGEAQAWTGIVLGGLLSLLCVLLLVLWVTVMVSAG